MSQRKYALEMISEAGLIGAKPKWTPMEQNLKLTNNEYDVSFQTNSSDDFLRIEECIKDWQGNYYI